MARLVSVLLLVPGCARGGASGGAAGGGPLEEARALVERGEAEAALVRLRDAPAEDPDALYWQGRAHALKAERAPAPAGEFKPEELTAVELFERTLARRPDHAGAHLALARVLSPHALRRHAPPAAGKGALDAGRSGADAEPAPGVDFSVDRVLRAYEMAMAADARGLGPVEGLIAFATAVERLDAAEAAYRELVKRQGESPDPLVRYGDFLRHRRQDGARAIEQYRQALIWKPDDDGIRARVADIYLARGSEYFAQKHWAMADAEFRAAEKFVTDRSSAQGQALAAFQAKLKQIRAPQGASR